MSVEFLDGNNLKEDGRVDKGKLVNENKSEDGMLEVDEDKLVYCLNFLVNSCLALSVICCFNNSRGVRSIEPFIL